MNIVLTLHIPSRVASLRQHHIQHMHGISIFSSWPSTTAISLQGKVSFDFLKSPSLPLPSFQIESKRHRTINANTNSCRTNHTHINLVQSPLTCPHTTSQPSTTITSHNRPTVPLSHPPPKPANLKGLLERLDKVPLSFRRERSVPNPRDGPGASVTHSVRVQAQYMQTTQLSPWRCATQGGVRRSVRGEGRSR